MCEYYRNRADSGAAHHRNDSLEALFAEDGDELCAVEGVKPCPLTFWFAGPERGTKNQAVTGLNPGVAAAAF